MARIMGIDVGFVATGVVVAEGDEIIHAATCRTEKRAGKRGLRVADDDADRAQQIARFLLGVISEFRPAGAAVELPSGGAQGARANRSMGLSTAAVAAALEAAGVPAEWVTPGEVKKAAAGHKDASKEQVELAVREQLTWTASPPKTKQDREHVFDAAGAVLAIRGGTLDRLVQAMGPDAAASGQ